MEDEISSSLYPGLYILIRIPEHVCDYVPKRALKVLEYRLQIFLAKDHYLESLQLYGGQVIPGQPKKCVRQLIWRSALKALAIFGLIFW